MSVRAGMCGITLLLLHSSACVSQSNDALVFTIEQALATAPAGADLGRSVEGDWDRVCIFRPGTTYERVDSVLGAAWGAVRETEIDRDFRKKQNGLSASDLGRILGHRELGSRILRGERGLSKRNIQKLADYFKVGLPLQALIMLATAFFLPLLFPFY